MVAMHELIVPLFSFVLVVVLLQRWSSTAPKLLPPSPRKLPIIRNLHQLGKYPHRSLRSLSQRYGPLMLLHFGNVPVLVVSSADVAKEIIKNHDLAFADKPTTKDLKKIFYDGNDIFNLPYGERWRKLRRIVVHELLSSSRVKSFDSIREKELALLVKKIEEFSFSSRPVNFSEIMAALSNDLISLAATGKKHSEEERGKKFLENVDECVELLGKISIGEFIPWLAWIDRLNGRHAAVERLAEKRDEVFDEIIEDHLKNPRTDRENFVDILLGIYKGDIPGVSIDLATVKGLILDVFGAGTETSATTLVWIMTELIRHPAVMKKLQDEIRGTMEGKHDPITEDDLEKMHYLKAIIKETFRLRPPAPVYTRLTRENVNLMGYEVAARTLVIINAWAIGRDPNCWDNPENFMPERFLNSSVDTKGFHYQLIPFGAGRRICPGLEFATVSIEHTVANLMLKFDWALPDGAKGEDLDVTERPGFTVGKKNPLLLVATVKSTS